MATTIPCPTAAVFWAVSASCRDRGFSPGFAQGFDDLDANTGVVGKLIDSFNAMLSQLTRTAGFEHVRYVDLRDTLSHASGYKRDWANELHPDRGFSAIADVFATEIAGLP